MCIGHWACKQSAPSCALSIKLANKGTFMCTERQACKQKHLHGLMLLWLTDSRRLWWHSIVVSFLFGFCWNWTK
jgi:hypothetical protein